MRCAIGFGSLKDSMMQRQVPFCKSRVSQKKGKTKKPTTCQQTIFMNEGPTKATTVNWDGDDDNAKKENNRRENVRVRRIPDHRMYFLLYISDFERSPMRDGQSSENKWNQRAMWARENFAHAQHELAIIIIIIHNCRDGVWALCIVKLYWHHLRALVSDCGIPNGIPIIRNGKKKNEDLFHFTCT